MNPEAPAVPRSLLLMLFTAALQGLARWWLANAAELGLWQATDRVFRRLDGKWTAAGQVVVSTNDGCCRAADVLAALRRGDFRTVTPRWQQLQLGNRTYTFAGP